MYNQNEYDIIIENILKDIESMDKNTKEKWEIPLYSGNQIKQWFYFSAKCTHF